MTSLIVSLTNVKLYSSKLTLLTVPKFVQQFVKEREKKGNDSVFDCTLIDIPTFCVEVQPNIFDFLHFVLIW